MARGVSSKAQKAEEDAFAALGKVLKGEELVSPAGFDAGFPDFAFRINLASGRKVDLHYEYKADYKAQMGSMRDWIFNGNKFYTNDRESESKQELLEVMNNSNTAMKNGKRLLNDLKTHFDPGVKELYSGSMTIIKDKATRRAMAQLFVEGTENYQIAQLQDTQMGNQIIKHYKKKFKNNLKSGSDASMLFMMLKDKVWYVDKYGTLSTLEEQEVAARMGLTKLDKLQNLTAKLEVRIQPRGMSNPSKMPSIDAMASFRLAQAPTAGGKVI